MSSHYAGSVQSSIRAASAWRLACFVLCIAVVAISAVAMHATGVQRTVLVPYGLMAANGAIKINGNPKTDGDYLAVLARADVATMLDWQPKTVDKQLDAFLARLTPAAYAKYNLQLRNTAEKYANLNVSETFYPNQIIYQPPFTVKISGTLDRYIGDTRHTHTPATYTLHYAVANGIYAINAVETSK